jgi:hypothetical protein
MLWEISEGRRVKPPSEIYRPGDLLPYTLQGISWKCALLLGQCTPANNIERTGTQSFGRQEQLQEVRWKFF